MSWILIGSPDPLFSIQLVLHLLSTHESLTDPFSTLYRRGMGLDETLFHQHQRCCRSVQPAGLGAWSELAKPGNLLYPVSARSRPIGSGRNRRECLIGSVVVGRVSSGRRYALGTQLQGLVQRPRPCVTLSDVHQLLGCGGAFSFPSNHAANTAAAAAFFQDPLSTIRLDQLAVGLGDRGLSCVHRRSLPDRCDRGMGRGWSDRRWCGLAALPVVPLSSGSQRRREWVYFHGRQPVRRREGLMK